MRDGVGSSMPLPLQRNRCQAMTIRNLDFVFAPKSVAVIGASETPGSVGSVLTQNIINGGLAGPIHAVNPKRSTVHGLACFPTPSALPFAPDLAVIATPPETVPGLIAQLAEKGTRAAVVLTAGFGEGGHSQGLHLRQAMLDAAQPYIFRIVGPNCLGIIMPHAGLNASFAGTPALAGNIGFLTQSGAVATAVIDWAASRGIGFSHVVTLGDMADVDFGDTLDYLARDPKAKSILLYVEAVTHARKFMSAARAAARAKPVIVIKAGRFAEGAKAAASHTGALAGSDQVYDAAFRRAGLLRVTELYELFEAAETLSRLGRLTGERLAILTNGGGAGVLATDALIEQGGRLAALSPQSIAALEAVLPKTWSHGNPVDIIGDAGAERYQASLDILLSDSSVDAVLVLNCPTAIMASIEPARVVAKARAEAGKPILAAWLGGRAAEPSRELLAQAGVAAYETPASGVRAFMHLVKYHRNQEALSATPPSLAETFEPDTQAVARVIAVALAEGREWLDSLECRDVLRACGIASPAAMVALSPVEAAAAQTSMGCAVALKIRSRDILHKSDIGGVVLDLETPEAVEAAGLAMLARAREKRPDAVLHGFTVEAMVRRPGAHELLVGMSEDRLFGPAIMFGQGGTGVEVMADTAMELPPLNAKLAQELMGRTRIHRLLKGYRDRPPADLAGITATLVKVSQLVIDFAEIKELDINPLLADADGVIALDARIRVGKAEGHAHSRLAIKPYPKELEQIVTVADGRRFMIRPIRAEDEPSLVAAFSKLSAEDIRLRFHAPLKSLDHVLAGRFTQINYDREMALVLTGLGPNGGGEIFGVARLAADPDNVAAEYAVIVRSDVTGHGLGRILMTKLIAHARDRGLKRLFGLVLAENNRMLDLGRDLGMEIAPEDGEPGLMMTRLEL